MGEPTRGEEPDQESILEQIGDHPASWWLRMLAISQAWVDVIPWPLGFVLRRKHNVKHSALATCSLVVWGVHALITWNSSVFPTGNFASDSAKLLFAGAFLIGTILSLSVAIPGQAIAKFVLVESGRASVEFVAPFGWGFIAAVSGGVALMVGPMLPAPLARVAVLLGAYGAFSILGAISHAVRMYLMGLLLWGIDERGKASAAALASAPKATAAVAEPAKAVRFTGGSDPVSYEEADAETEETASHTPQNTDRH